MARYRLNEMGHFNDTFTLVSREIERDGMPVTVPVNQEQFAALVEKGSVIDVSDDLIPGPHMEPMDAAAEAQVAKFPGQSNPAFHADMAALPIGTGASIVGPAEASFGNEVERPSHVTPVMPAATAKALDGRMQLPKIPGRK
jgi:hypothetical protein